MGEERVRRQDLDLVLWGPIIPIGTIHMGKGWAYGPIQIGRASCRERVCT